MKKHAIAVLIFLVLPFMLWATPKPDIENVNFYYHCTLNGASPKSSYCALKEISYHKNIPLNLIEGATHFLFGNDLDTDFATGIVSYPPYAMFGQNPVNVKNYPFDKKTYSFTVEVKNARLSNPSYDNPNYYIPTFVLPPLYNGKDEPVSTCTIIGKSIPANLAAYPLTLLATTRDMLTCNVETKFNN